MFTATHSHSGSDSHDGHDAHMHGTVDPLILTTDRGIWALKWSLVGLLATAFFQLAVVWLSGSVALLADTIHNLADAATAIPLWIAFRLARWRPNKRFSYGYGRVEDLAGVASVLTLVFSTIVAGYESIARLLHPQPVGYLWARVARSPAPNTTTSTETRLTRAEYRRSRPLNNADGFGDFEAAELLATKRVEVYKGANALRFGVNSLGGAINLVTRTGEDNRPFELRSEGGSFGYNQTRSSIPAGVPIAMLVYSTFTPWQSRPHGRPNL
jgi:cation efflux family protein